MKLAASALGALFVCAVSFGACKKDDDGASFKVCSDSSVATFSTRCAPNDFVDMTGLTGDATSIFGGAVGFEFSPSCIRVSAGQNIRLDGDFSLHPFTPGCGPAELAGTPVSTGTSHTFSLSDTGTYGFFCANHGLPAGHDMVLTVEVVP